jgi:hypothetical protein
MIFMIERRQLYKKTHSELILTLSKRLNLNPYKYSYTWISMVEELILPINFINICNHRY